MFPQLRQKCSQGLKVEMITPTRCSYIRLSPEASSFVVRQEDECAGDTPIDLRNTTNGHSIN